MLDVKRLRKRKCFSVYNKNNELFDIIKFNFIYQINISLNEKFEKKTKIKYITIIF
uniref:Uncharacterized protein n=1 Tax=Lepeophtheirus salmonis TaxID=72036 RepID=A0A0K2T9G0_LEPSM